MRILVFAKHVPRPTINAGDRRFVALLELMARSHSVDFAVPVRTGATRHEDAQDLAQIGVRNWGEGYAALSQAFASGPYHVAFFEFHHTFHPAADRVRERLPGAALLIDSVDVHFAREEAAAALGLPEGAQAAATRARELGAYRAAGAVIAVTDEDAAILEAAGGIGRIYKVPIVLPPRQRPVADRLRDVVFVGGFLHRPNVDAVFWFVREIWPAVKAAVPSATFYVVGSQPPPDIRALSSDPDIVVTGQVPDTGLYLDRAAVSVAPLRYGGGMKGKVIEALASGVPLVTTSCGAQGIAIRSGQHAVVTDDAAVFASAISDLLQEPERAEQLGAAGQSLAAAYSPDRIAADIDAMLHDLVPHPRAFSLRAGWLAAQARVATRAVLQTLRIMSR